MGKHHSRNKSQDKPHALWQFLRWSLLLLVTVVTYYVFTEYPKYRELSGDYVVDSSFESYEENWSPTHGAKRYMADAGVLTLISESKDLSVRASQRYASPIRNTRFRVCGEVRYRDIVLGEKPWFLGSVVVNFLDAEGQRTGLKTMVTGSGSTNWQSFCRVIEVSAKVEQLELEARLLQTTGQMQVRNLSFYEVEARPDYEKSVFLLIGLWVLVALLALLPYLWVSLTGFGLVVVAIAMALMVLGVLAPVGLLNQLQAQSLALIPSAWGDYLVQGLQHVGYGFASLEEGRAVSKLGHFFLFCLLAFVMLLFARRHRGWSILALLLLLPIATEVLQLFIEGRTLALLDVKIDYLGVVLGLVVAALIRYPIQIVRKSVA